MPISSKPDNFTMSQISDEIVKTEEKHLVEFDMSAILTSADESFEQKYVVLVDNNKTSTVGDFTQKIQSVFNLPDKVVCTVSNGAIFPDGESVNALYETNYCIKVAWKRCSSFIKPLQRSKTDTQGQRREITASSPTVNNVDGNSIDMSPSKRAKYPTKAFSVGDFLNNLRTDHTKHEQSMEGESVTEELSKDSFNLQQPPKRKRVRKHKSKKAASPQEVLESPNSPITPSQCSFSKPMHLRFEENEETDNQEKEWGESETAKNGTVMNEFKEPEDLDALFSLRQIHGAPPIFMRTTPISQSVVTN